MKPAPEPTTTPDDLLRVANAWLATSVVDELAGPLAALRANVQAARRLLARDCPHSLDLAATLADVLEDADRLETVAEAHRAPSGPPVPRSRLQPEREIAAATALLAGSSPAPAVAGDMDAPRVTGHPGLIGAAVLHLLLGRLAGAGQLIQVRRPRPASLVVQVVGDAAATPAASLHSAAAVAVTVQLGGKLDLHSAPGPRLEIPLEL